MYNYFINQESGTVSSVTFRGILAAQFLADQMNVKQEDDQYRPPYIRDVYHWFATPATFDHFRTIVMGEYQQESDQFEVHVAKFYTKLLASQESLGAEFEKVLHENLWNLYES
ncbi:MAG: hypothetical protein A2V87_11220 [Deltaproteobacteria bacterium RBG_16_58_17]|nr:MAG: hypothetical protein A2V87_11220 [Deltaproteobacteria bacterium RBG_16_58_17]OHE17501.1 MAG: hypothetical protein A2X96_00945 [Syntrophobacterales bacterium GWC2_56_13]OHE20369.1 MAG: hypothetical protein A2X95_05390 [Syntrophobacterales bacterium GWF2_56_9]